MAKLTKLLVLASLAGALAFESWHARFLDSSVPFVTALAAIAGAVGGRFRPRHTAFTILLLAYWFPVLFVAATSRPFLPPFFLIWSAALAGLASDAGTLQWNFPRRWRFALVLWALAVAVGWPLVAFREMDFESLALVERYHVSNTGIGGSPTMMVAWIADVVVLNLTGLLWFDWLCRRATVDSEDELRRWIARPLAIGAVIGALLAFYQGAFDLGFRSGGVWPSMGRAAGPLLDANATGMIAALWSAGLLAFVQDKRLRWFAVGGALLCWAGLWMTGSRTALLAALIALVPIGLAVIRSAGGFRARRKELTYAAIALVAAVGIALALPNKGPFYRFRYMPTFAGDAGVDWLIHEFWDRSSYGGAAAKMIGQHPAAGIGIGMFHLMGADYIRLHLHEVPPDNAQNWWRHNLVEMGVLGAAGLIVWSLLFVGFLARSSGSGERNVPAAALKGALVSIGLASLMGMPAQSLPVVLTFWTLAFWYVRLVDRDRVWSPGGLGAFAWIAIVVVLGGYLTATVVDAQWSLRPPLRAGTQEDFWPYAYGVYAPPEKPPDGVMLWTEKHGVAAIPVGGPIMMLTVRAEHPDISQHPVRALVKVNNQVAVDMKLSADVPVLTKIDLGSIHHTVIEAKVDRTWRSDKTGDHEVGLSLSWKFLLNQNDARASSALDGDDRVVEEREQPLVQPIHVGVDRLGQLGDAGRQSGGRRVLQTSAFGDRRSEVHIRPLEPGGDHEKLERVGVERTHVRDVADVALEERDPARGVDRLEHDRRART